MKKSKFILQFIFILFVSLGLFSCLKDEDKTNNELIPTQVLASGQKITSSNGFYSARMEKNGNLVITKLNGINEEIIWASETSGEGNFATLNTNGGLAIKNASGLAIWTSGSGGSSGFYRLVMGNDGHLVIYNSLQRIVWATTGSNKGFYTYLTPDKNLTTNQMLISENGQYTLIMQSDGNLVIYKYGNGTIFGGGSIWASGTNDGNSNYLTLTSHGSWTIKRTTDGFAIMTSGSGGRATPIDKMIMQDDGNLVIYTIAGEAIWASKTSNSYRIYLTPQPEKSKQFNALNRIYSENNQYFLTMQSGGNLVLFTNTLNNKRNTGTSGSGNYAVLQTDGNFVVYNSGGASLWATGTNGKTPGRIVLQDDGNLILYSLTGEVNWAWGI